MNEHIIVRSPHRRCGEPHVRGTRVPAYLVRIAYELGRTKPQIAENYRLTAEQVQAAIDYVEDLSLGPYMDALVSAYWAYMRAAGWPHVEPDLDLG